MPCGLAVQLERASQKADMGVQLDLAYLIGLPALLFVHCASERCLNCPR